VPIPLPARIGRLANSRDESCAMSQGLMKGMVSNPMLPEHVAGAQVARGCISTAFHGVTQRLRDPLRLAAGDKCDAHAGLDKKVVTAPAVLQQRD
jgi:hypothetical protein